MCPEREGASWFGRSRLCRHSFVVEEFEDDADLAAIKLPWRSVIQSAAISPSLTAETCCSEIQGRRVQAGLVSREQPEGRGGIP